MRTGNVTKRQPSPEAKRRPMTIGTGTCTASIHGTLNFLTPARQ